MTRFNQLGQIRFIRVKWHAAHRDVRAFRLTALGQRNIQDSRRDFCVIMKQLIKITHPVKKEHIRMRRLQGQILRHHRRMPIGEEVIMVFKALLVSGLNNFQNNLLRDDRFIRALGNGVHCPW